ncbi:hypothetical protein EV421DRAFT_1733390 [Armillaria borealis]|uniref:Uncharacterized protein n=1 Tax=Armillaria borealis TaxID=47425 RepID=A0AA39JTC9_9AGAR|nr:hypothetical protein EV421DRAFT_1733390 [Armillaria borealis]
MSTSAAQAIPSLISLVNRADNVMHRPLEFNAQLPCVMAYFDEAVKVKTPAGRKHKTYNSKCNQTQNLKAGSSESSLAPLCGDYSFLGVQRPKKRRHGAGLSTENLWVSVVP